MSQRPLQLAASGAAIVAATLVLACGGEKVEEPTNLPPGARAGANILSDADVARYPAGSPQRAVLAWARAVQFGDTGNVLDLMTPAVVARLGRPRLESAVLTTAYEFARPEIVAASTPAPDLARVRAFLVSYDADRRPTLRLPATFELTRIAGRWRLSNASILIRTARDLARTTGTTRAPLVPARVTPAPGQ